MHRPRLLAAALAVACLLSPAMVLAADEPPAEPVSVPGVVDVAGVARLPDGLPVAGAVVTLHVVGSDIIAQADAGQDGAFSFSIEAEVGDVLEIDGFGPPVPVGEPTAEGCQAYAAPAGRLDVTLGTLPPAPVDLVLDGSVDSEVCSATGTPRPAPRVTPPATDVADGPVATTVHGSAAVVAVLALIAAVTLLAGRVATRRAGD